jgi:hypothetical protein
MVESGEVEGEEVRRPVLTNFFLANVVRCVAEKGGVQAFRHPCKNTQSL